MNNFGKIYEGIEERISRWEDIAKEEVECNIENGYSMDETIDDADESALELISEIEKMSHFLLEDSDAIGRLVALAQDAYSNVKDYIISRYEEGWNDVMASMRDNGEE